MRPAGLIGVLLIVFGAIVLVMGGLPYVKDRDKVDLGIVKVTTEKKGFIPPVVGVIALVAGIALVFAGRGRRI
jgi:uncharacterized membrane protein YidH (DUF202 family)